MPVDFRSRLLVFGICVGIVYLAFLIGWLLRDHLGVPRSRLKYSWVVLIVTPVALGAVFLADALLPRWVLGILLIPFLAACLPWLQARLKGCEPDDPLRGREARVVQGHPSDLQVEIDGEVWNAQPEQGLVILEGERVVVRRRDGFRLVVGRP